MIDVKKIHEEAMEFSDQAEDAKKKGNPTLARSLFYKAFRLESKAANLLKDSLDAEPTRSILYRSAASLALDCDRSIEAIGLASEGLRGKPPIDVDIQLELLLQVAKNNLEAIHRIPYKVMEMKRGNVTDKKFQPLISSLNSSRKRYNKNDKPNK